MRYVAARDPQWRARVRSAKSIVASEEASDETGEPVYPLFDKEAPEYWLGAHANYATSARHAERLMRTKFEIVPSVCCEIAHERR